MNIENFSRCFSKTEKQLILIKRAILEKYGRGLDFKLIICDPSHNYFFDFTKNLVDQKGGIKWILSLSMDDIKKMSRKTKASNRVEGYK